MYGCGPEYHSIWIIGGSSEMRYSASEGGLDV